ncbi:MAG TPA: winged helix-turn-helix domain-containing protein [Bryobacteraceae bacterium]|nr:winged helix-turn-helix domain-containing protein [Bryobacteraceae bacterium]
MMDHQRLSHGFRLREWTVRPEDGSISSPQSSTRLEPLLMQLLVYLCSRAKQVIPKQEIIDAVWNGRFISDETIKGAFHELRKALNDSPRRPRFIETLPKRGYRVPVDPEPLSGTTGSEAQDLKAKGYAALSEQPTEASLKQARLYFERAVESEPNDAGALAGLARTYALMAGVGVGNAAEYLPRAGVAASRALEMDPNLGEPHLALAVVYFLHQHDHRAAEREFRIAVERKPGDSLAHMWYARFLASQQRPDEAIAQGRRALDSDPLSLAARRELLNLLFAARRYEETIAEARRLLEINPDFPDVHLGLVWVYYLQGNHQLAFESFMAGMKALGVAAPLLEEASKLAQESGISAILRRWAELLENNAALGQRGQLDILVLRALLGDRDRCFDLLGHLRRQEHPFIFWVPVLPVFDNLRSDPRYGALLVDLGFSQPFPNP